MSEAVVINFKSDCIWKDIADVTELKLRYYLFRTQPESDV